MQPYCDDTLKQLAHKDVKKVDVICPGFAADCLETLEEMNIQNQQLYVEAGGENFNYIPCLNDNPDHLDFLSELAAENLDLDRVDSDPLDRQARLARAMHKGARQ